MYKLAPSILAADFYCLGDQIAEVERAGAEYLHIDVMDGMFVPSISFGIPVIESIRRHSNMVFDVHLMVKEPIRYVEDFARAGADIITVHTEACTHLHRTVTSIRKTGCKAGITLNPGTPLCDLDYCLNDVDLILLMSVNPGFGGQPFIEGTYDKLRQLRKMLNERGLTPEVEVDGGITPSNVESVLRAGAQVIVSGSAVFSGDITKNIAAFKEVFRHVTE